MSQLEAVGIDVGTSTMLVGRRLYGQAAPSLAELVPGSAGRNPRCWPADAYLGPDGELYVGPAAQQEFNRTEGRGVFLPSAKRYIRFDPHGCHVADMLPQPLAARPWPQVAGADGRPWSPTRVLDELVFRMLRAVGLLREEASDCVEATVGCPAEWQEGPRQKLKEIVSSYDLDTGGLARVVEEPILAAHAYLAAAPQSPPGNYIVYDFGGGSFDAAWIEYEGPGKPLRVAACLGDLALGGDDVDVALATLLEHKAAEAIRLEHEELSEYVRADSFLSRTWDSESERLKREIRGNAQVALTAGQLMIPSLSRTVRPEDLLVLSRAEIREAIKPFIDMTILWLDRLARQRAAHRGKPDLRLTFVQEAKSVEGVILVGGMTQMPMVREMLEEALPGVPLLSVATLSADEMVVWGAGLDRVETDMNTHRLSYEVQVEFLGVHGETLKTQTALQRYQSGYDGKTELVWDGDIPSRLCDAITSPPGATSAVLVYVDSGGNATRGRAYRQVNIRSMPALTGIPVASAGTRLQICLRSTSLLEVTVGSVGDSRRMVVWPTDMPWLGELSTAVLGKELGQKGEEWDEPQDDGPWPPPPRNPRAR